MLNHNPNAAWQMANWQGTFLAAWKTEGKNCEKNIIKSNLDTVRDAMQVARDLDELAPVIRAERSDAYCMLDVPAFSPSLHLKPYRGFGGETASGCFQSTYNGLP